jgi:hypothetical protein
MKYNTQEEKLKLPEYGRNIQQMVDTCMRIEDREERNACAYTIASIMGRLFPEFEQEPGNFNPEIQNKIWDLINIMSDFKLDVDFPCEVITREKAQLQPERIPYSVAPIRMRHYGKNIQNMVKEVSLMEDGPEKDDCILKVAYQMKKLLFLHNKEGVDDSIVIRDLATFSEGRIQLDPATFYLRDFVETEAQPAPAKTGGKKKKKKK